MDALTFFGMTMTWFGWYIVILGAATLSGLGGTWTYFMLEGTSSLLRYGKTAVVIIICFVLLVGVQLMLNDLLGMALAVSESQTDTLKSS